MGTKKTSRVPSSACVLYPSRISSSVREAIRETIPNRLIYFDENLPNNHQAT